MEAYLNDIDDDTLSLHTIIHLSILQMIIHLCTYMLVHPLRNVIYLLPLKNLAKLPAASFSLFLFCAILLLFSATSPEASDDAPFPERQEQSLCFWKFTGAFELIMNLELPLPSGEVGLLFDIERMRVLIVKARINFRLPPSLLCKSVSQLRLPSLLESIHSSILLCLGLQIFKRTSNLQFRSAVIAI